MSFNNARPKPGAAKAVAPQHVIEEYTHRAQIVRCVCGWSGSSASYDGRTPSEWTRHVSAFRAPKR